ncbi:MAG: hypothetical protein WCE44_06665 [Candidatus Velthaea sp.]
MLLERFLKSVVAAGFACAALSTAALAADAPRRFTANDLVSLDRLSDPQIAPDGSAVIYDVRSTDLQANRTLAQNSFWLKIPISGSIFRILAQNSRSGPGYDLFLLIQALLLSFLRGQGRTLVQPPLGSRRPSVPAGVILPIAGTSSGMEEFDLAQMYELYLPAEEPLYEGDVYSTALWDILKPFFQFVLLRWN